MTSSAPNRICSPAPTTTWEPTIADYRSSAQEWLDEKLERAAAGKPLTCRLPLALHLVCRQTQRDETTGNQLTQELSYRLGYYDGIEREFRGFGLLLQTDTETSPGDTDAKSFTATCLKKLVSHRAKNGSATQRL
ncbi:toxin TcdB middle/N-terminal domain-containing protein [Pseudomonas corrugata]